MKFGKQLESEAENIPSTWRPYLLHYKALKKLIAKVAIEIEKRGLCASLLREGLRNQSGSTSEGGPRIRYYFTGEPPNVRPCIQFTYNRNELRVHRVLQQLINNQRTDDDEQETAKLEYNRTVNDTEFFTLTSNGTQPEQRRRRQSAATILCRELLDLTLNHRQQEDRITEIKEEDELEDGEENSSESANQMRSIVIELEYDDEFFHTLMTELQQAAVLQDITSHKFEYGLNVLEHRMSRLASPTHTSDMYTWRAIFSLYMDAQIFGGESEADRSTRSVKKSKAQMEWFLEQLDKQHLRSRIKSRESREAFEQFIALNTELITLRHYQVLNQIALTKILKKHDKRSGLTASESFPSFVKENSRFFSSKLANILCASVFAKLVKLIPQPDDYLCPVCMAVAWRPIRLVCGHVFCVRCLIKAQRRKMDNCPLCRHRDAVKAATTLNLDVPLQNLMRLYFPREVKEKRKDNQREQAIEDIQAMTGRVYTQEQIMRMSRRDRSQCHIM